MELKKGKFLTYLFVFLVFASAAAADTVTLKNGDRVSGTIEDSDGKDITLKTDFAGEIKIHWGSVASIATDKPLFVITPYQDDGDGHRDQRWNERNHSHGGERRRDRAGGTADHSSRPR